MLAGIAAVKAVGAKFAEIIGGTAAGAFNSIFGRMTFGLDQSLEEQGFFGQSLGNVINFQPGIQISPRLVTHELGHAFEQRIYGKNGNKYEGTNNPIEVLIHKGVWDKQGNLITGTTNHENSYLRYGNTGGSPFDNGYTSNDYHSEAQWHPKGMKPDGNTAGEDWADIFMNWTFDTFAPGPAGTALNSWTTTNMAGWISEASR